jgi:hypothetical protein
MALESPVQRDGDNGFIGFASRLNPLTLPAGMLQDSVNMRLDRGVAQTRKGSKRLTDALGTTGAPLTLSFVLDAASPPIVQNVYTGGLFSAGTFSSQNYDNASEYIALAGRSEVYLWADGKTVVTKTFPTSPAEIIETTDTVSVVQAFDRLYVLRYADVTVAGWEEKVTTAAGITVSTTTATVNVTAHGYTAGMRVRIEGSSVSSAFDGHEYDIQTAATNSFTITVPSGTAADASAGMSVRRVKPPLYWDGGSGNFVRATAGVPSEGASFTTMPSTGWATYFNNRLWFARNRDTVAISDVLDPDVYDPFFNSFRAGAGGDDRIVAIHPWVDGSALVFCRKSIWLATLNQFSSTDGSDFSVDAPVSGMTLLTNEIGCSARNTICTAGNFVFFLSDAGVYRLDSRLDLKLRGDTKPLSEPISDIFDLINQDQVENSAFAAWHNNRYLLAIPSVLEDGGNRLLLAYSALNDQWEYRDTFPASAAVNNIAVANYNNLRRVFAIPRTGNLYLLEENESGDDDNAAGAANATNPTVGRIVTRRFDFQDMHSKRFLRTIADVVVPAGATITTKVNTINPDQDELIANTLTNNSAEDEDYNMKAPVRYKAHAAEVIYETSGGRPEIRSASIEASPKSLPATETRNTA